MKLYIVIALFALAVSVILFANNSAQALTSGCSDGFVNVGTPSETVCEPIDEKCTDVPFYATCDSTNNKTYIGIPIKSQSVSSVQEPIDSSSSSNYLRTFNNGTRNGIGTERHFTLIVEETHKIPITSGNESKVFFPAWTFNGTVPGPTLRMTEGEHVKITVINANTSKHHHSLHMHSMHHPIMDGTFGASGNIAPGANFTYDFIAGPTGLYPYHCHVSPIVDHINRGLYGAMIIDPVVQRAQADEMMMMMNSYDLDLNTELKPSFRIPNTTEAQTIYDADQVGDDEPPIAPPPAAPVITFSQNGQSMNFTGVAPEPKDQPPTASEAREELELEIERDNEFYTVNGKAFEYMNDPIELKVGQPVRIYLVSMTEFDPVNNFHLHSDMFKYTPAGTLDSAPFMTDVVTLSQGDRGIIEFTPKHEGLMMFHSHINEFTELGWMAAFNVVE